MIEVNRNGDVWVFAQQDNGKLNDVSLELLSKGRELADQLKVPLAAALLGQDVEPLAQSLFHHGADKVYLAEHNLLETYQANTYAKALCELITRHKPQIVIYGATPRGRDLAPRVASAMKAGLTADCTDLDIGDNTDPSTKVTHKNLLLQIRPAFGGNIIATIVNYDRWPQMATVRAGVMPMPTPDTSRNGSVVKEKVELELADVLIQVIEKSQREKRVNLKGSRIIVSGGAGVGSPEGFGLLRELANALGGEVGASRAAVDSGFIDKDHQVGQTGTTVRPALYIAVGISGAIQHRAGMQESAKVLAVNTDPDAPIFSIAHYGIVGDYREVVPKLIKAVKARA
ncbi:MAG: electron transfer flavoprotein subunit alpha/FixB family protein [Phycisphaerae bacterium]|nr:electron transfer flavoprotein subunit alpha/FixB family protein [Phycisphaerae bacterium]